MSIQHSCIRYDDNKKMFKKRIHTFVQQCVCECVCVSVYSICDSLLREKTSPKRIHYQPKLIYVKRISVFFFFNTKNTACATRMIHKNGLVYK